MEGFNGVCVGARAASDLGGEVLPSTVLSFHISKMGLLAGATFGGPTEFICVMLSAESVYPTLLGLD